MIRLFLKSEEDIKTNSDTTKYNHNKRILSECISCKITEDLEGIFDLDLEYPVKDSKNLSQYLVRGNVIESPIYDSRANQLLESERQQ
jgi:phage-related protein